MRSGARSSCDRSRARGAFLFEIAVATLIAAIVVLPLCAEAIRQDSRARARILRVRLLLELERFRGELFLARDAEGVRVAEISSLQLRTPHPAGDAPPIAVARAALAVPPRAELLLRWEVGPEADLILLEARADGVRVFEALPVARE